MLISPHNLKIIKEMVGPITVDNLKYIDAHFIPGLGIFSPSGGVCQYATLPEHTHPGYQFVIAFDDTTRLLIGNQVVNSRSNHLFALGPNTPHQELDADTPPRYFAIFVKPEMFEEELIHYPLEIESCYNRGVKSSEALMGAVKRFMIEFDNKQAGREVMLKSVAREIIHELLRCYVPEGPPKDSVSERIVINRAIDFMYSNLGNKLSLEDLARNINYSSSHFVKLFKKETGESPIEYLNRIRLKKSKKMLLNKNLSITDTAFKCGFTCSSYFSEIFKKKFSETPRSYRARMRVK